MLGGPSWLGRLSLEEEDSWLQGACETCHWPPSARTPAASCRRLGSCPSGPQERLAPRPGPQPHLPTMPALSASFVCSPSVGSRERPVPCLPKCRDFTWWLSPGHFCRCGFLFDSRCYCFECVDTLVSPGTSGRVHTMSNWVCFLCLPFPRSGLLQRRRKWRAGLKAFYDREAVRGAGAADRTDVLGLPW